MLLDCAGKIRQPSIGVERKSVLLSSSRIEAIDFYARVSVAHTTLGAIELVQQFETPKLIYIPESGLPREVC